MSLQPPFPGWYLSHFKLLGLLSCRPFVSPRVFFREMDRGMLVHVGFGTCSGKAPSAIKLFTTGFRSHQGITRVLITHVGVRDLCEVTSPVIKQQHEHVCKLHTVPR